MHAVATGDPQRLRWVIAPEQLPVSGTVRCAPGRLGALLADGVIAELTVGGAAVEITLSAGHSWRARGDEVRAALDDALLDRSGWRIDAAGPSDELARVATELLAGPIGALAASHGGSIDLVAVTGDQVTVRMSGSCHGCPASASTLHDRLQHELRRRLGDQVTVCTEDTATAPSLGRRLLKLMVR